MIAASLAFPEPLKEESRLSVNRCRHYRFLAAP